VPDQEWKSIPEVVVELKDLTISYAKQETVEPIKGLKQFFKWGVLGAALVAFGMIELALALLRFLQTETGTALTGNWSWVPYVAATAFLVLVIVVAVMAINREPKEGRQ
jgi:uncharacterized membrane protein YidH (DUF202 family)